MHSHRRAGPRLISLLIAAAIAGFSSGCTQVQVGPGLEGEYKLGELQMLAPYGYQKTYEAAKAGMKDFGLLQVLDDHKTIEAEVRGRDTTDSMVIVKIKEVGPNQTSVKIRYGVLKPELVLAQKLYQAIEKRL